MTKKLTISFEGVRQDDMDLISKVRDFGEDLSRELWRNGQGELPFAEADGAIDRMTVRTTPRFIGEITQLAKKLLKKHHLESIADIKRE